MGSPNVSTEDFYLRSEGLELKAFAARPDEGQGPFPAVQIHHGGGGYEPVYSSMAEALALNGIIGVTLIHRGYPGSQGHQEYGGGEIADIGNLTDEIRSWEGVDEERLGIMGYSRGAHNTLLAVEQYDFFTAAVVWSPPVDMIDHVQVNPWIADMFGGTPDVVPEAYRIRSSLLFVDRISCPLLILHGETDDVVPVRHSQRLAKALEASTKDFKLHIIPDEGHIWSPRQFQTNWRLTRDFFRDAFHI